MRILPALLMLLCLAASSYAQHPLIGVNLEGNDYWSEDYTFTDISNHVRTLFPQKNGAGWGQNDPGSVVLGADGYPTFLASDHSARTLWDLPKGHAGGQHVLLWDGTGDIDMILISGNDIVSDNPGRIVFDLPAAASTDNRRGFDIKSTDVNDPVRNIRIVPIGQEAAYTGGQPSNPFRSVSTDRWSNMGAFRYMDWGKTNNSTVSTWDSRAKPGDLTQTDRGIAIEHQINHANVTGSHPWFNIPHLATDEYIENMATMVRDTLDDGLVARIEYSNEVWNAQFTQYHHANNNANAEGIFQPHWYSKRSVEMFDIFENVFTNNGANPEGMDRLLRVMGTQVANDWIAGQILSHNDAYLKTDVLAIAPYFGTVPTAGAEADAWTSATWPERFAMVDDIMDYTKEKMDDHVTLLNDTTDGMGNHIYDDIKLFAYEGGQHFVGATNTHGDTALTQLMQDLSGRPEMRQWYFDYLTYWDQIGGEDFMLFASVGDRSKWGSWGHYEYEGQPLSESPKMQGILDFLASISPGGDFDADGDVDGSDFLKWQRDGLSAGDLADWAASYGPGSAAAASAAVPEPASLLLLVLGGLATCGTRRTRSRS